MCIGANTGGFGARNEHEWTVYNYVLFSIKIKLVFYTLDLCPGADFLPAGATFKCEIHIIIIYNKTRT